MSSIREEREEMGVEECIPYSLVMLDNCSCIFGHFIVLCGVSYSVFAPFFLAKLFVLIVLSSCVQGLASYWVDEVQIMFSVRPLEATVQISFQTNPL